MRINKITVGFVIQVFDTNLGRFVEQSFTAGDECDYEIEENDEPCSPELLNNADGEEAYLPFDMVQPK